MEADGRMWGIPQVLQFLQLPSSIKVVTGQLAASGGQISGSWNDPAELSCSLVYTCRFSGLASASQLSVNATASLNASSIPGWAFNGTPQASYKAPATFGQATGTWSVDATFPSAFGAQGSLVVTSAGAVSAANIGGCAFSGTLTPVVGKGYYRFTLASAIGACATSSAGASGVAYFIQAFNRAPALSVAWHSADQKQFFFASGTK